jgi:hypothetical protein
METKKNIFQIIDETSGFGFWQHTSHKKKLDSFFCPKRCNQLFAI